MWSFTVVDFVVLGLHWTEQHQLLWHCLSTFWALNYASESKHIHPFLGNACALENFLFFSQCFVCRAAVQLVFTNISLRTGVFFYNIWIWLFYISFHISKHAKGANFSFRSLFHQQELEFLPKVRRTLFEHFLSSITCSIKSFVSQLIHHQIIVVERYLWPLAHLHFSFVFQVSFI